MRRYVRVGPVLAILIVASVVVLWWRAVHASSALPPSSCGPGTIAFRAPSAGERRFTCPEGSWYDEGLRLYRAQLRGPVGANRVTLVLMHTQTMNGVDRTGELLFRTARVSNPNARTLAGKLDFSIVYDTSPPAGAPPFGTYALTIHRGASENGPVLARGKFTIIED